jgi:hypothetical protein
MRYQHGCGCSSCEYERHREKEEAYWERYLMPSYFGQLIEKEALMTLPQTTTAEPAKPAKPANAAVQALTERLKNFQATVKSYQTYVDQHQAAEHGIKEIQTALKKLGVKD